MTDRITEILICTNCARQGQNLPGRELLRALDAMGTPENIRYRAVDCLNACGAPLAMAAQADGKSTYLFTGIGPDITPRQVADFAVMHANSPDGMIADARPLGALRFCLAALIPPPD